MTIFLKTETKKNENYKINKSINKKVFLKPWHVASNKMERNVEKSNLSIPLFFVTSVPKQKHQ